MPNIYDQISKEVKGAWVVHHGRKTAGTMGAGAQFPSLEAAGKAASLLSQFAASDQLVIAKTRVGGFAKAAGLNPKMELPPLLEMLRNRRVIDVGASGDIECLGLTSTATVQHACDLFEAEGPTVEERAAITLAEITSHSPLTHQTTHQKISDEFGIPCSSTTELLRVSETVGFIDAEGRGKDKLYFNGNLFRRDNIAKTKRVLDSLSSDDSAKVGELDARLERAGCVSVEDTEIVLGVPLFEKLRAAGMYDVNFVSNPSGEFGFVTKPAAFHKYSDPMSDDAFDLAKTLVSALTYGMTLSSAARGKITLIKALLKKMIIGLPVGPATAIGEDYRVLEMRGVVRVTPGAKFGFFMKLLKRDIGQMALSVLTTGEAASVNSLSNVLPGSMMGYIGPEKSRSDFRRKQLPLSRHMTEDVLQALRQEGGQQ